jgi:hypothetical protein
MISQVFEYFFEPDELEPYYSRLPNTIPGRKAERSAQEPSTTGLNKIPASTHAQNPPSSKLDHRKPNSRVTPQPSVCEQRTEEQTPAGGIERTRIRHLIGVHALGQYVFCRRSAILAIETGDQTDQDEPLPRLTYLPNFDREKIEEVLSAKITQLGFYLFYSLCLISLLHIGLAKQNRLIFYPSFLSFLVLAVCIVETFMSIAILAARRRKALNAEARELDPHFEKIEPVNWWSMLNTGYESIRYEQPFQHPELPLVGAPWRVLQRGSQRIPVVKAGGRRLGNDKQSLYPKHEVRLVAYALLLEASNHIQVPYGLIFPADSPSGLAFPITDELRVRAKKMLKDLERTLTDSQLRGMHPEMPGNRSRCANCELGRPHPISESDVKNARNANEQLVVLKHHSGRLFRCQCADRFGAPPPHRATTKLELTALVG